jgi:hypothetical protein
MFHSAGKKTKNPSREYNRITYPSTNTFMFATIQSQVYKDILDCWDDHCHCFFGKKYLVGGCGWFRNLGTKQNNEHGKTPPPPSDIWRVIKSSFLAF